MEEKQKPINIFIARKKGLTLAAAIAWLAVAAGWITAIAVVFSRTESFENAAMRYGVLVAGIIFGVMFVAMSALNFRNLAYPYVCAADGEGITDHSGFVHIGLIRWSEIEAILPIGGRASRAFDMADGQTPAVSVLLKDKKSFVQGRSFIKKLALLDSCVRIRTLCAASKRDRIYELLLEQFEYYVGNRDNG